jgi:hypothetical protein
MSGLGLHKITENPLTELILLLYKVFSLSKGIRTMALRSMEIDWDIHKLIESERKGFDEPPHLALRRLLNLPDQKPHRALSSESPEAEAFTNGVPWFDDGVKIPHGSKARMRYGHNKQEYFGEFLNGLLVVNGIPFDTLSKAANELARTKNGKTTQLNGWRYWEVQRPTDTNWILLGDLRDEARKELAKKVKFNL